MMKMRMMIAVSILALAICASPASAVLVAYEGFDYSGQTSLDTQSGGSGWTGAWSGAGGTLSDDDTSLNYVGNPNSVIGDRFGLPVNDLIQRQLTSSLAIGSGDTWYVSLLLDYADATTWWSLNMASDLALWTGDVTTRAAFVGTGGSGEGRSHFGYGASSSGSFDGGYSSGDIAMVVMRIFGDTDRFIIDYNWYISPEALPTSEPGSWEITVSDVHTGGWDPDPISYVRLEKGNADDGSTVDELIIGTTWADVVAGAAALPGDFDADNDVDGVDFGLWQSGYPTASGASLINGDADGDGDVDGVDFGIWQANYPTNVGGAAIIPEPATLLVLGLGGLALLIRYKR